MKSVTASEARKNWFRLLDEVADGEVVVIRRGARNIVLRCESLQELPVPDYSQAVRSEVDEADRWGWEWTDGGIRSTDV